MSVVHLLTHSAAETQRAGADLGRRLLPGDAVLLTGDLGAGKTTLTQGIAQGLDIAERPRSPTFVMAAEYRQGRLPLYHIDLYRIDVAAETADLGLDEYLHGAGVTVVEWAERAPGAYPADALWIALDVVDGDTRRLRVTADGPRHRELADGWLRQLAPQGSV